MKLRIVTMSRAVVTRKPLAKQPRTQSKRWRQMTVTLMMAKAKWSELRVLQTLIEEARSDTRNYYKRGVVMIKMAWIQGEV